MLLKYSSFYPILRKKNLLKSTKNYTNNVTNKIISVNIIYRIVDKIDKSLASVKIFLSSMHVWHNNAISSRHHITRLKSQIIIIMKTS